MNTYMLAFIQGWEWVIILLAVLLLLAPRNSLSWPRASARASANSRKPRAKSATRWTGNRSAKITNASRLATKGREDRLQRGKAGQGGSRGDEGFLRVQGLISPSPMPKDPEDYPGDSPPEGDSPEENSPRPDDSPETRIPPMIRVNCRSEAIKGLSFESNFRGRFPKSV